MDGAVHEYVLSRTQRQVLLYVADTGSVAGAAARLHLSPRTVERHLDDIRGRLGVHTTAQCVLWALRGGLWEGLQTEPVRATAGPAAKCSAAPIDVPLATDGPLRLGPVAGHYIDGRQESWSAGWTHDGLWLYFEASCLSKPATTHIWR